MRFHVIPEHDNQAMNHSDLIIALASHFSGTTDKDAEIAGKEMRERVEQAVEPKKASLAV